VKKGVFQGVFPSEIGIDECMVKAKEAGFSGIELCIEPSGDLPFNLVDQADDILGIAKSAGADKIRPGSIRLDSSDEEIVGIKEKAESIGIQIHSVLSLLQFMFPITSDNKKVREIGIKVSERLIYIANLLGADSVLFIPGMVTASVSYEEAHQRSREVIKFLLKKAEQSNVILNIENVWNRFLLSPLEMREYIDWFDSEWVAVYFDVGNVLIYGYPEQWIKILGSRIKKIHVKDFLLEVGNIHGFTHLFQGDVNWGKVIQALREIEYDGFLTVEVPPYKSFSIEALKHSSDCLNLIIQELS